MNSKEEKYPKKNSGVSKLDSLPINTVLGTDINYEGDISGDSIIRIDGNVKGNISLKQGIILGEKAYVEGNMDSDYIILFSDALTVKSLCVTIAISVSPSLR